MARKKTETPEVDGADEAQVVANSAADASVAESSDPIEAAAETLAAEDLQDESMADVLTEDGAPDTVEPADQDAAPADESDEDVAAAEDGGGEEATPEDIESEITVVSAEDADDAGAESAEETIEAQPAPAPPPPAPEPQAAGRAGFVPLVLGGLIAAGLGWGVATFTAPAPPPSVDPSRVDQVETDLRTVEGQIAELPAPPAPVDLGPLETAQADLVARLDDLAIRIEALEVNASQDEGSAGAEILAGLRADLGSVSESLNASIEDVSTALDASVGDLTPRLEALEAQAAEFGNAEAEAEVAMRRAARNEIAIAVRDGQPYPEAAAVLDDLPDILASNAQAGVPPKSALTEGFGSLARDALAEARATGATEGGLGGFARSLVNARSLSPREGDDPDAVLSRVEAAVRAGDLQTALSEIEALPPEASAVLSDWSARARTRVDAEAALQEYLGG